MKNTNYACINKVKELLISIKNKVHVEKSKKVIAIMISFSSDIFATKIISKSIFRACRVQVYNRHQHFSDIITHLIRNKF